MPNLQRYSQNPNSAEVLSWLIESIESVILDKTPQIKKILCCWLAGGHVLMEDFPGTGKTMLARAIARSCQARFNRVQFTPDLLPADVVGSSVYSNQTQEFKFFEGPLFSTIFLGDEINRATPRTQSALLEAMAEGQITVDGVTHPLNPLFFVIATQNPVEHFGTFPLPEAQLDRFMMKLSLGYPSVAEEIKIIKNQNEVHPIHHVKPVISEEWLLGLRAEVQRVEVSDRIYNYAMAIINKTRQHSSLSMGASSRASIALIRASQAMALLEGSSFVTPKFIYDLAEPVLAHRLILTPEARLSEVNVKEILSDIVKSITVPIK